MHYKRILYIAFGVAALLLLPLVAMQFSTGVNWTLSDFVVMGVLLFITGTMIDLAMQKAGTYRLLAVAVIVILFFWLWVELAVGLFTTWGS